MPFSNVVGVLRPLSLAILFSFVSSAAAAQTVIVRSVPAGEAIELFVNATKAATAVADPSGLTRLTISPKSGGVTADMDSRVFVDVCNALRRIHIVDRNLQPATKDEGCDRREVNGIFLVRQRSTLVIEAGALIPTILLRQGSYDPTAGKIRVLAPRGLSVFGGGGIGQFDNIVRFSCGTTDCDGDSAVLTLTAGADYWITRWLGAEATYMKPRKITAEGAGGFFKFTDTYDAHLITLTGKVGAPIGRARLFGKGGGLFHSATSTSVVTIADVDQTLKLRTEGWSWVAGGGIEVWLSRRFALFSEVNFGRIRGSAVSEDDDVEGEARDDFMGGFAGFRVKIF